MSKDVCLVLIVLWPAVGLAQDSGPLFAPDGRHIAFSQFGPERTEIALIAAAGGKPRVLATFPGRAEVAAWFPDGRRVLVTVKGTIPEIWAAALDGFGKNRLGEGENPRLSPAGRLLAAARDGQLRLIDLPSTSKKTISAGAGWRMGDWLDDESFVAMDGEGSLVKFSLSAPAAPRKLVPHRSMAHCFVAAAANAKRRLLAVTSDDMQLADSRNPTSVWIFDGQGRQQADPIAGASRPQWTREGRLFFARRSEILATDDFKKLRSAGKGETWAASPDGSLLAVTRRDADTNGDGLVNWLDASRLMITRSSY